MPIVIQEEMVMFLMLLYAGYVFSKEYMEHAILQIDLADRQTAGL